MGAHKETILKPSRAWVNIPAREIWAYKDLVFFFVRRDFVARYKQTILGPIWYLFAPLMTVCAFYFFGAVNGLSTDGLPRFLFYQCGMMLWVYFDTGLRMTSSTFTANAGLFGKIYFPRFIVPLSNVCSNLINLVLQLVAFTAVWLGFKFFAGPETAASFTLHPLFWLFPLLVLQTGMLALGIGMVFAGLSAKYRDLQHLTGTIAQLWLFVSPVAYPYSSFTGALQTFAALNPVAFIIEASRLLLLGEGTVTLHMALSSLGVTVVVFFVGLMLFTRIERTFIDTV